MRAGVGLWTWAMRAICDFERCSVTVRYKPNLTPQWWDVQIANKSRAQFMRIFHTSLLSQTPSSKSCFAKTVATSAGRHVSCASRKAPRKAIARDRAFRCASYESFSNSDWVCPWCERSNTFAARELRKSLTISCNAPISSPASTASTCAASTRCCQSCAVCAASKAARFCCAMWHASSAARALADSRAAWLAWPARRSASASRCSCSRSFSETSAFSLASFAFSWERRLTAYETSARAPTPPSHTHINTQRASVHCWCNTPANAQVHPLTASLKALP